MSLKPIHVVKSAGIAKAKIPEAPNSKTDVIEDTKNLIRIYLSRTLLQPQKMDLKVILGEQTTIFEVAIEPSDFGRLVGAKGKNISALRTLVLAMTAANGFRSVVAIKDEDKHCDNKPGVFVPN